MTPKIITLTLSTSTATTAISDLNDHSKELMTLLCPKEQEMLADVDDKPMLKFVIKWSTKYLWSFREAVLVQSIYNAVVNSSKDSKDAYAKLTYILM